MAVETPGMYRKDGRIFKVQIAIHGSGKPYAKELIQFGEGQDARFEYAQGMVYKLNPSDMMTLEEAKEFGALYGVCCVCGRLLTDEKSIEAGIGPVCAKGNRIAFADAVKLYQSDAEREAAIQIENARREDARDAGATPVANVQRRTITMGENKFGPVFQLRWDYNDPQFNEIKMEVKSWDWQVTKTKWDSDIRAWTVDAKSDAAAAVIMGFALRREFSLSPEAEASLNTVDAVDVYENLGADLAPKSDALPVSFNDLLKVV